MVKYGYIDDAPEQYENFRRKLKRNGIELILFKTAESKSAYVDQIYYYQVDGLLIDYKMAECLGYNGSTLISYINDCVADIPCFILTAVETDKITDKLVPDRLIYTKDVFDTEADDPVRLERFKAFVQCLKNSAEVFESRRKLKLDEYQVLNRRRMEGKLDLKEEEDFIRLYHVLSSYGMVEKLPDLMLKTDFEEKFEELLLQGRTILQGKRQRES